MAWSAPATALDPASRSDPGPSSGGQAVGQAEPDQTDFGCGIAGAFDLDGIARADCDSEVLPRFSQGRGTFGPLWPLGGLSRSILVLVFAIGIALGVLGSLSGLWSIGHPDQPSDIEQEATVLGFTNIQYTANTFAALIFAGYALALLCVAEWLYRHRA